MRRLFICQTPYQIIVSLCVLIQKNESNNMVDFLLTNTFNGYAKIADKIKSMGLADNVYTIKMKTSSKCPQALYTYPYVINFGGFIFSQLRKRLPKYDELYFWNCNSFCASAQGYFYKCNPDIKIYLFEEGYSCYFAFRSIVKPESVMKITNKKNSVMYGISHDDVEGIYLFRPDLALDHSIKTLEIDRHIPKSSDFREMIVELFDAHEAAKRYDRKYILFEGFPEGYDDSHIFEKIIEKVGKDNVIVKLHPRQPRDRFSKLGIKTLGADGVPWEAVLCARDFSENVMISVGSSALISPILIFGEFADEFLLFRFIDTGIDYFSDKYDKFWNQIEKKNNQRGLHLPKTEKEFWNILSK